MPGALDSTVQYSTRSTRQAARLPGCQRRVVATPSPIWLLSLHSECPPPPRQGHNHCTSGSGASIHLDRPVALASSSFSNRRNASNGSIDGRDVHTRFSGRPAGDATLLSGLMIDRSGAVRWKGTESGMQTCSCKYLSARWPLAHRVRIASSRVREFALSFSAWTPDRPTDRSSERSLSGKRQKKKKHKQQRMKKQGKPARYGQAGGQVLSVCTYITHAPSTLRSKA